MSAEVKTYLRATLKDGSVVVSAFSRLANVQRYAAQIFARVNVFNAWQIVSRVHPVSGESCLVRRRRMISGDNIVEIEKVTPVENATDSAIESLDPDAFESALDIQAGQYGLWTPPAENLPEGAVQGARYPIHRDPETLVRYVILRASPELRFALETAADIDEVIRANRPASTGPSNVELPGDGDDDLDD